MEIRSTRQSFTPKASQDQRQAYKASLEKFEEIAPAAYDRYQNRSALVDNLAPIPAAIGVIGGTAAIWAYGEPMLDKIVSSVHPVVAIPIAITGILGPVVGGLYGTMKGMEHLHSKVTHDPKFEAVRNEHSEVRDTYRERLLEASNDEGVKEISNPKWLALQNADEGYYHVGGPVRKEASMNRHVNDLEWLLDMRQQDDWRGEIARAQDDPEVARRLIRGAADDPGAI